MDSEQKSAALSKPCVLIIVVASVERFVYKGVASNLVTYLTDVVKSSSAAKSVNTWNGVTSMLPLASAILADSFWDRYSTISCKSLTFSIILLILDQGLAGLASWAMLHSWLPRSLLFLPLYLISVGQGGYDPSLQAFGADQLLIEDDKESLPAEQKNQVKGLFFQWWYFGICSGSLLGNSMSYIQDTFGWGLGFAIPCGVMILSVIAFCFGNALYTRKEQNTANKPSWSIFKVLKEALHISFTRKVRLPARADDDSGISELELEEKALKDEFTDPRETGNGHDATPNVTKTILRLLPIWTTLLIFAVNFQQPMTFFTNHGMLMNHKVGSTFVIPPATLQSSTTMSVILLMPLYDKIFVPLMRLFTREEKGITVLQRTGIGMVLSVVAMVVAAAVESKRLHLTSEGDATQLSIFWLLPQYILLGVADVFTVVGMQEFFYTQVPSSLRTTGIALYLSVFGFGSFLGAFLISVLEMTTAMLGEGHGWFSDDPQQERLDKYYLFLALVSTIGFVFFTYLCKYYNDPEAGGA
ncbi:LOW QUALITY PROTEIN: protein NRT1/ PTR FAMILY 5.9-like [Setaria italica]|uniref:LOW QUALITY PROTEIN: protein NRT1/ PTR FAMILY 5.9-like n=1 Tax=Setaria italica TaxID=4555 RepID=UPI000BE61C63|nr:LOW QUALITY PROTEIN: protein NRT1/ PTR FAMILY 5.9-like [Setaria italica]